ncbi:hypothetical protein NKJ09_23265 [Mesorhizobium sp. M0189]
MTFVYLKGATAWEAQIGRAWFSLRYKRFWRTSGLGFIRIVEKGADE